MPRGWCRGCMRVSLVSSPLLPSHPLSRCPPAPLHAAALTAHPRAEICVTSASAPSPRGMLDELLEVWTRGQGRCSRRSRELTYVGGSTAAELSEVTAATPWCALERLPARSQLCTDAAGAWSASFVQRNSACASAIARRERAQTRD
jgi:hypothetical protein